MATPHNPFVHDEPAQHQQQGQVPVSSNPFSSSSMSTGTTAPSTRMMQSHPQQLQQQHQNPFMSDSSPAAAPQSYITPQQQQFYAPPPGPPPPLAAGETQQQYYAQPPSSSLQSGAEGASSQYQSSSGEMPSSPSTNPFRYAGASAPAGAVPASIQQDAHPQVSHISDELQGLDFGNGPSSSGAQNGYGSAAGYAGASAAGGSSLVGASDVSGAGLSRQGQDFSQTATDQPIAQPNAAQDAQTMSDAAYARRLLEQQKMEQHLGTGRGPVRTASGTGAQAMNGSAAEEEAQWSLKDVYWRGMERKIITQVSRLQFPPDAHSDANVLSFRTRMDPAP